MTWYKAFYGSWNDPEGVQQIDFGKYCFGTYSRKEAFNAAQATANKTGKTVTVLMETPTGYALKNESKHFYPEPTT